MQDTSIQFKFLDLAFFSPTIPHDLYQSTSSKKFTTKTSAGTYQVPLSLLQKWRGQLQTRMSHQINYCKLLSLIVLGHDLLDSTPFFSITCVIKEASL
ncbi:MAG: hypothetical protein AAF443_02580 [Chlamydiota bacterium]